jgi:type VI secretion system protein ImpE
MNQLNVAGELDAATLAMVQTYREALRCESLRAEIFAGRHSPLVLGQPPQWLALLMEALRLGAQGKHGEAERLRSEAFEAAPATSGTLNGEAFEWIADADGRLGPVLEAIVNGRYYWVPFERIREIQIEAPEDLRDMVWLPAHFELANEGEAFGLIPSRYPSSESSDDGLVQLGRKTEWQEQDGGLFVGLGQRLLTTEAGDYSILDVRQITLNTQDDTAAEDDVEAEAPPDGTDG